MSIALTPEQRETIKNEILVKETPEYGYLKRVANIRQQEASQALHLSMKTNLDMSTALNNPAARVENLINPEEFKRLGFTHPEVKTFLEDPIHMAIVRDRQGVKSLTDLQDTSSFGTAFTNGAKALPRTFAAFMEGWNKSSVAATEEEVALARRLFGDDAALVHPQAAEMATSAKNNQVVDWEGIRKSDLLKREFNEAPKDKYVKQFMLDFVENSPQIAAQIVATALTGGAGGAVFMGTQIAGGSYEQLADEGVDPSRAFTAGMGNAFLQAPLEQLGIGKLFKPAKQGAKNAALRKFAETVFTEGLTEALQQYPEEAAIIWAKSEGKTWTERGQQFLDEFGEITKKAGYAGLLGMAFGGATGGVSVAFDRNLLKAQIQQLDGEIATIKGSPVMQRSPEAMEQFLNRTGEKVYIEGDALLTYFQESDGTVLEDLNLTPDEVQKAAARGETIEIPKGTYEVAAVQHEDMHAALKDDISFDETSLSAKRIEILNDKDIRRSKEEVLRQQEALQVEKDKILHDARQAGMPIGEASGAVEFLSAMAKNLSTDPATWLKENAPLWMKGGEGLKAQYNQSVKLENGKSASVIEIDPASMPQEVFAKGEGSAATLRKWLRGQFQGKEITIADDSTLQRFTGAGLDASLKRKRHEGHNEAYAILDKLLENAVFDSFEEASEGHPSVKGQNRYYAACKIGDEYYSIRFKVDIPRLDLPASYKDHKTAKIKIEPSLYGSISDNRSTTQTEGPIDIDTLLSEGSSASKSSQTSQATPDIRSQASISDISIDVLRGDVKPSGIEDGTLYQQNKGAIGWNKEGRAVITLLGGADASTVVHELLGHFAVNEIYKRYLMEDAPEQVQKDWQALLTYAEIENWETATAEQRKKAHERWAEAAESYILEGKAPSAEMRPVMARFKEWMRQIYRGIKRSPNAIPLTDEVRQVFDRMLATEEQIAQRQYVDGYYNKLPQVVLETLTPAQKERLDKAIIGARQKAEDILSGKILKSFTEEAKQEITEIREQTYEANLAILADQQIYKTIDAVSLEFSGEWKNAWTLAKAYQQKEQSYFNGTEYKGNLSDDQSVHFDYLAELSDYSSGSELATKILETEPINKAATHMTDTFIKAEFDGVYDNKAVFAEEAKQAMYNEYGAELMALELAIIEDKLHEMTHQSPMKIGDQVIAQMNKRYAKLAAKEAISQMTIDRASNLQTYISSERKAAEKSAVALANGDLDIALEQKKLQLYNHAMVQESLRVRREYDGIKKYLQRQRNRKKANWDMETNFVQAADLLRRFGMGRSDYNPALKRESLMAYVARQENLNMPGSNPDIISIAEWLEADTEAPNARAELTIEQYKDVANAIRNIRMIDRIGVNSDAFAVIDNGGSSSELARKLMEVSARMEDVLRDEAGAVGATSPVTRMIKEIYLGNKKVTEILLELDGMKDFGPWHTAFYRYVKEAADYKSDLLRKSSTKLDEAFKRAGIDNAQKYRDVNNKKYIPEWDVSLSKMDMRVIALNMGSESNMERLVSQAPVGFNQSLAWKQANWTEPQIKEVLAKYLTEKDFHLVQDIWNAINLYTPYNEMVTKMTGFSLPKVEAMPVEFTLPDGNTIVLQGGYYPLKQDRRSTLQAELNAEKALGDFVGVMPYPNSGASKTRTKASYSVDLDFNNAFNHLEQVTQDIAFRPVMHDINKLMRKEEVRDTLRHKLGEEGYKAIVDWQGAVARGRDTAPVKNWMAPLLNWMRARTVTAGLLFRPGTIVQNNANFTLYGNAVNGFTEMDAFEAYTRRGVGDYIPAAITNSARAKELRAFVFEKSVMMRDKMDAPDFTLRELQSMVKEGNVLSRNATGALQEAGIKIELTQNQMIKLGGDVLAWSDQLTDIPMWLGAYDKALSMKMSEKDAVHFADTVIERSTGSGRLIDTSGLQRGGSGTRLLTMYTGFFNTQLNRWMREANIFMDKKDVGRLFVFTAKQYIGFGVLSALYSFKMPDDDKYLEWFIKEIALWPLAMVPFIGSGIKVGIEQALGFQSFGYTMSPLESQIGGIIRAGQKMMKDDAEPADKAEAIAAASAFLLKYPDQINDWFFNAWNLLQDEMDFEFMDLAKRRPKRER